MNEIEAGMNEIEAGTSRLPKREKYYRANLHSTKHHRAVNRMAIISWSDERHEDVHITMCAVMDEGKNQHG